MVWKARSQAAYQGYSHLSGIEITSSFIMWNHSVLRTRRPWVVQRIDVVLAQPAVGVEQVVLLRPEHPGQGLAHDPRLVLAHPRRGDGGVERVGLLEALAHHGGERRAEEGRVGFRGRRGQAQAHHLGGAGGDGQRVVRGRLRAFALRVDGIGTAVQEVLVDAVLDVGRGRGDAEDPPGVGLVLREQERRGAVAVQVARAQLGMGRGHHARPLAARAGGERRLRGPGGPRPGVPEPERGQEVHGGRLRPAVPDADPDEDVLRRRLRVFDEHVEVPVVVEDAGVDQLEFGLVARAVGVRGHELVVRIRPLRVLVEVLHVRVGRSAVEVEVVLLHVFAVVALAVGQAEEALLEDRVLPVPERDREAELLLVVGDARPARLPPSGRRASAPGRAGSSPRRGRTSL